MGSEEAVPRVFGVREAARFLDERGAAEEIAELYHDKEQKQEVDEAERGRQRNDALDRLQRGRHAVERPAEERPAEITRDQKRPEADEEHVGNDGLGIEREEIREDVAEDRIRRGEQAGEDQEHRRRQQNPQRDSPHVAQAVVLGQLAPRNVAEEELEPADDTGPRRAGDAANPIERIPSGDRLALHARGCHAERPDECQGIEGVQRLGVATQERETEQHRGDREPGRVGSGLDVVPAQEPGARADERGRAEGHVEPPRHRTQQRIADDPAGNAGCRDLESEPGAWRESREHGHTASCVGRPPNRRSREWNS